MTIEKALRKMLKKESKMTIETGLRKLLKSLGVEFGELSYEGFNNGVYAYRYEDSWFVSLKRSHSAKWGFTQRLFDARSLLNGQQ